MASIENINKYPDAGSQLKPVMSSPKFVHARKEQFTIGTDVNNTRLEALDATSIDKNEKINKIARVLLGIRNYQTIEEARKAAENIFDIMEDTPDIREDKVQRARERVKTGFYFKREVLLVVAEKLLRELN